MDKRKIKIRGLQEIDNKKEIGIPYHKNIDSIQL
jgi:hypothetical protein